MKAAVAFSLGAFLLFLACKANEDCAGVDVAVWPSEVVSFEGEDVSFNCTANVTSPLNVTWLENGVRPTNSRWQSQTWFLEYQQQNASANGSVIECVVDTGECRARASSVLYVRTAPRIAVPPRSNFGAVGEWLFVECEVEGGPPLAVRWYKDGSESPLTADEEGRRSFIWLEGLNISSLREEDEGNYSCEVDWGSGRLISAAVFQAVLTPPRIVVPPVGVSAFLLSGHTPLLNCLAEGDPLPVITWYKGGAAVKVPEVVHFPNGSLPVGTSSLQSSLYYCTATNAVGSARSPAVLVEVKLPSFSAPVLSLFDKSSSHVTVMWASPDLDKFSKYDLALLRGNQSLGAIFVDSPANMATFSDLAPYTNYTIQLSTRADFTSLQSDPFQVRTTEEAPSDAPNGITVSNATSTAAILVWEEPSTPNGLVTTYSISYVPGGVTIQVGGTLREVELLDLQPFTNYTVSIQAVTGGGVGPPGSAHFSTQEGVPSVAPGNVKVIPLSATAANVSWTELSTVDLHGNLRHYGVVVEHGGRVLSRVRTTQTSVPLTGLHRFALHRVTLFAATQAGSGPNMTYSFVTLPAAPSNQSEVVNLTAVPLSSTDILLTWLPPTDGIHSNITGYLIKWERRPFLSAVVNVSKQEVTQAGSEHLMYRLTSLTANALYNVTVRVVTTHGLGTETDPVVIATLESTPGPPRDVVAENANQPQPLVTLSWKPPETPNGVITTYQYTLMSLANSSDVMTGNVSAELLSVQIGPLAYYTNYSIALVAFTSAGEGAAAAVSFTSVEGPPTAPPTNVVVVFVSAGAVDFRWGPPPPQAVPGRLRGYVVEFDGRNYSLPLVTSYHQSSLQPYTNYTFRVAAVTAFQGVFSPAMPVMTEPSDRGSAPEDLRAEPLAKAGLNITWRPPRHPAGPVDGYTVSVQVFDGSRAPRTSTAPADTLQLQVAGLEEDTEYQVTARASSKLFGEWSTSDSIFVFTTNKSVPGDVALKLADVLADRGVVMWDPPTFPLGRVLHYKVTCPDRAPVEVRGTNITCDNLLANRTYSVHVQAVNSVGPGNISMTTLTTACEYGSPEVLLSGGEVKIQLPACPVLPTFSYVLVVVREGTGHTRPLNNYTVVNLIDLTLSSPGNQRRRRRQSSTSQPYISANLTLSELGSFRLGDGEDYRGYSNRPLQPGAAYQTALVGSTLSGQTVVYPSTQFNVTGPTGPTSEPPNLVLYVIIAIAAFIAVVILIVVVIIVVVVASLCRAPGKAEGQGFARQASFRMSLKKTKIFDPLEVFRSTHNWPSLESHPPVPFSGFHSRMAILQADSNFHFLQEYESIDVPEQDTYTTEAASAMVNASKNRYANIVPFDHSRVKLLTIKGLEGSDYINANYCDGFMQPRGYIAAQGPLKSTIDDFWRLVWEQQVHIIVMVTNAEERGREKCAEYWPSTEMECFGNLDVVLESVVTLADFTIRTICLNKAGSPRDARRVTQFQFTSWPDHGVPVFATSMLAFTRRVQAARAEQPEGAGPLLVHCSAGVGRTGTFITVDSMIQKIKASRESLDVFGHVTMLRSQRNFMVQTEDQYFFIYEAIAECIACGNTECDMEDLPGRVGHLVSIGEGEESAYIEMEFKHLALEKNDPNRFVFANEPFNKQKNRFVNILPFDSNRVFLEGLRGVQGSDYINASYVDSYQRRRAFIACQAPLESTVADFWRMVWEQKVPIIVVLTRLQEHGVEQCVRYWPTEEPLDCGELTVEHMVGRNTATYSYREFRITPSKSSQSHVVRHFHFHCWPEVGVPSTGIPLVELIKEMTKMYRVLGTACPVVVHCSSGVGRTGVFIALSIIIERMKLECIVDVFQTVKMLRIQRPAMVQTLEQYQFCYDTTVEVLSRFDSFKSLLRNSSGAARLLRGHSNEATTFLPKSPTPGASYPES